MKESDLAQHFINHFDGFDIYPEVNVPYGGICDIVMKMGRLIISVEVKTTFNLSVIYQANRNKAFSHMSYVAVPRPSKSAHYCNREAEELCRELGIGVLYYDEKEQFRCHIIRHGSGRWTGGYTGVKEQVSPIYRRFAKSFQLYDWQKRSVAGSVNDRLTHFKITVEEITAIVSQKGGRLHLDEVFKDNKYHYASIRGARISIISMIGRGVIKTLAVDGDCLALTKPF